jgi:methylisocitrate lyase
MPITIRIDDQNYFALPPERQMTIIRGLLKAIDGPVLTFFPPPGHTTADLAKAGAAMTRFPASALGAAANAMFDLYQQIHTKGTDEQFIAANSGPFTDPLALMRAMHLDRFAAAERKSVANDR